jgi:hypothetical protein
MPKSERKKKNLQNFISGLLNFVFEEVGENEMAKYSRV